MSSAQGGPLAAVLGAIQNVDIEQLMDDQALQAETLSLARKLTSMLEGSVNRATDLVFKVSLRYYYSTHNTDST
jgi:hypothetical protein